jgi:hypothetical protein
MTTLTELVEQIKQSTDFQANKRTLREKIQTDLHMVYGDGMFKISPELLAFVKTWPVDELYLEDVYQNPIKIDRQIFLVTAQQHYQTVMNEWHQQYEYLRKQRRV